jgi:putative glutamine amidotransferase
MPLIAISCTTRDRDGVRRAQLNQAYVASVEAAGLIPVIVPPLENLHGISRILESVQGVVLSGGEDIDPSRYDAPRHAASHDPHGARDACELELARQSYVRRVPLLAICRGIQLLNVAFGGTLIQDIPSEVPDALAHDVGDRRRERVHAISVQRHTRLAEALGADGVSVNSIHHQAVDRIGDGLLVSARSTDGVVEGVEWHDDDWWALGVQWHPEELTETSEAWDRRLFAAFAGRCGQYRPAESPAGLGD